ncbi:thioredoxin-like protein [Roseivirga pacifica]|uniref:Thioredoxin n=1 Tax=Roseivirga pacifica TaxID=1267423 RepID=A0A1I0Q376_9BACT|nr:thioredoxin family protein [Roseivirga pacifica]RKQ43289.1 thioredoxin-like protein [Roseivirga pacifica]SEW21325.1 Thioredoxin [Roseivirga pacifica]
MKTPALLLLISLLLNGLPNEDLNKEVTVNGRTFLYGKINRAGLQSNSYGKWFNTIYNSYQPSADISSKVDKAKLKDIHFKVFLGTWCGDSKRNVPAFYKTLDQLAIPDSKVEAWALDLRKKGPNQEEQQYKIYRVPTIIVYRAGRELGRFIERPKPGQRLDEILVELINKD